MMKHEEDEFPLIFMKQENGKTLRILGAVQIFLGSISVGLGIVMTTYLNIHCHNRISEELQKPALKIEDLATPEPAILLPQLYHCYSKGEGVWCGIWVIVAGTIGMRIDNSQTFMTKLGKAHLFFSIIAAIASMVLFSFGMFQMFILDPSDSFYLGSMSCMTGSAAISLITSVVSASSWCCGGPMLYDDDDLDEIDGFLLDNVPSCSTPRSEQDYLGEDSDHWDTNSSITNPGFEKPTARLPLSTSFIIIEEEDEEEEDSS